MVENEAVTHQEFIEDIARCKAQKLDYTIQGHNYLSHGFFRFSSTEDVHGVLPPDPTKVVDGIDRLGQILRLGLLSESMAERIGAPFSRNYSDPNNRDFISLVGRYQGGWKSMSHARAGRFGEWSLFYNPPPGSMFTIFIDPDLPSQGKDMSEGAHLRRYRVPPRYFLGLGVYRLSESDDVLSDVLNLMSDIYKDRPELTLPVYEVNGVFPNLIWPKQKTS